MAVIDPLFNVPQWVIDLANHVEDSLTSPVSKSFVNPGVEVSWDECCGGQLGVRPVMSVPTYSNNCYLYDMFTVGVSIIRCVTIPNSGIPSADQLTADAGHLFRDKRDIAQALQVFEHGDVLSYNILSWTPQGPEGGCSGSEYLIEFKVAV